ncbi:MAG: hypothetical protein OEY29_08750 [Gammaproteobacteria bacterium]|nr:hypothetical protein [Gammaproteobacteria bacterium]
MAEVRLRRYLLTLRVRLAEELVLQHSASSPVVIGHELAAQIHDVVKQQQMGYYPPLEFFYGRHFAGHSGLDPELMEAADGISWLLCRLVRNELQSKLRQVFSSVKFQSVQTMAYTMPPVRYGANNALYDLAQHYTPLSVKLEIMLSMISKNQPAEGAEAFISNTTHRWLKDSFESIEVSSVTEVSPSD